MGVLHPLTVPCCIFILKPSIRKIYMRINTSLSLSKSSRIIICGTCSHMVWGILRILHWSFICGWHCALMGSVSLGPHHGSVSLSHRKENWGSVFLTWPADMRKVERDSDWVMLNAAFQLSLLPNRFPHCSQQRVCKLLMGRTWKEAGIQGAKQTHAAVQPIIAEGRNLSRTSRQEWGSTVVSGGKIPGCGAGRKGREGLSGWGDAGISGNRKGAPLGSEDLSPHLRTPLSQIPNQHALSLACLLPPPSPSLSLQPCQASPAAASMFDNEESRAVFESRLCSKPQFFILSFSLVSGLVSLQEIKQTDEWYCYCFCWTKSVGWVATLRGALQCAEGLLRQTWAWEGTSGGASPGHFTSVFNAISVPPSTDWAQAPFDKCPSIHPLVHPAIDSMALLWVRDCSSEGQETGEPCPHGVCSIRDV